MGFLPKKWFALGHEGKAFYLDFLEVCFKNSEWFENIKLKTEMIKIES